MADSDEKPRKKRRKNKSLQLLRAAVKSLSHAVPGLDEENYDTIDDTLSRLGSGFASQYMGIDDDGEVVNPILANLTRAWNLEENRRQGKPNPNTVYPGLVTDTLSLPNIMGNGPAWSEKMQIVADATHEGVNEAMDLAPPRGFRQNAANAGGQMLAQLPIPGKAKVDAGKGALNLAKHYMKKAVASPAEFFLPTVEPSFSNYGMGTLAGGALGMLSDEPEYGGWGEGGKVKAIRSALKIDPEEMKNLVASQIDKGSEILDFNMNVRKDGKPVPITVLKNPDQSEVLRFAGDEIPSLRMMVDKQGNSYVWDAREGVHDWVLKKLGMKRENLWKEMSDTPIHPSDYDDWLYGDDLAEGGKVKGALRLFRGLIGDSKSGISEESLMGKSRDGYSTFMSNSPDVAASYGNPDLESNQVGAIAPFHVYPSEVIEFPVKEDGTFDKFEFDKKAHQLKRGQLLVARNAYDAGPRASRELDPDMRYSYRSDVYAVGPDTDMKPGYGDYAEGGKVSGLKGLLKMISINPDSTLKQKNHQIGEELEEVLYSTNEAQRAGVLAPEEANNIRQQVLSDDESLIADALLRLHQKLFPTPEDARKITPVVDQGVVNQNVFQETNTRNYRAPVNGHGLMSNEEFQEMLMKGTKKAKGGKVSGITQRLVELFKSHDIDITHKDWSDLWNDDGTLNLEEAKEAYEDMIEGEIEVQDLLNDMGLDESDDPAKIQKAITDKARGK
jgi:hypothetical protein